MYRYLARQFPSTVLGDPPDPARLFLVHPLQLSRWLEVAWAEARNVPVLGGAPALQQLGSTTVIADFDLPAGLLSMLEPGIDTSNPGAFTPPGRNVAPLLWDHLMYAYLIESTGVLQVLEAIVTRIVRGETLGKLQPETLQWARSTEELLFRDPPASSIGGIESRLRPHAEINRRCAYYKMFGLDLPHPLSTSIAASAGGPAPWKADVGNGVNTGFIDRWKELLGQVWIGFENRNNGVGANSTDAEYVALLCKALDDMLGNRRQGGLLAREEFSYVAAMSWCHLTVETDTPLVQDLQATATSPAERLTKLAERVGMAPAARSRELFELADPMSALMWGLELGLFSTSAGSAALYLPNAPGGPPTPLNQAVNLIIDLWQSATGTRIKIPASPSGGVVPAPAQPLRIPLPSAPLTGLAAAPLGPLAMSGNGHRT